MVERGTIVLAIGYLSGLGMLGYLLQEVPPLPTGPTDTIDAAVIRLPPPTSAMTNIAAYDAMVERPLFNPTRRPIIVSGAPVTRQNAGDDAVEEVDGFRLAAVLKGLGRTTVLIEDELGTTRVLHPGERLGNWLLDEILDDRVVLVAAGNRQMLRVYQFDRPATRPKTTGRPAVDGRPVSHAVQLKPVPPVGQDPRL